MLAACLAACLVLSFFAGTGRAVAAEEEGTKSTATTEAAQTTAPQTAATRTAALTKAHILYMEGFPNRSFQPGGTLTRAQAAQMVYRLLEDQTAGNLPCSYGDLADGAWYAQPVRTLCSLGLFDDGTAFRPEEKMTRAEFVDLLIRLYPNASGTEAFSDVAPDYWAAKQIGAAVSLGFFAGYPDGTFRPDGALTRAEACTVLSRMTGRTGDPKQAALLLGLGLFSDVSPAHWAGRAIAEAAVSHQSLGSGMDETWTGVDWDSLTFSQGFHTVNGFLYYADRHGKLARGMTLGAYTADETGALTQTAPSYQMSAVPYISQIDDIYAWVGCEPVSALMGLKAKGCAEAVEVRTFLDGLPKTACNPEKGFVGSPYVSDTSKKTRTTIYPAALAGYCNTYCGGDTVCSDFRGASVEELRRELLAGNCVVAYETLWWKSPQYRAYSIEGKTQYLVSNNHAVLVYGYDPERGYLISDPYNYYNRGEVYQYWENAQTFDSIWNARKTGMVLR